METNVVSIYDVIVRCDDPRWAKFAACLAIESFDEHDNLLKNSIVDKHFHDPAPELRNRSTVCARAVTTLLILPIDPPELPDDAELKVDLEVLHNGHFFGLEQYRITPLRGTHARVKLIYKVKTPDRTAD